MRKNLQWLIIAVLLACGMFFFGCSDDDGGNGVGPGPLDADIDSSFQELAELMEQMIDSMSVSDDFHPDDFDFGALHQAFVNYLAGHPGDPKASFGAAMTSIMILSTDPLVSAMIDSIKAFAQGDGFFTAVVPNPDKLSSRGDMLSFPTDVFSSGIERNFLGQAYASLMYRAVVNPPKFSDLQNVVRTKFLPAIGNSIGYMDNILADPGFIFWVTPQMMGETSDSVEIDHADFLVFAGGLRVIKSFFHMAVAYDVDLPSYDSAGIAYMFDQSNDWMSLHPDGGQQMANSLTEFMDALDMADSAVSALMVEQSTDLDQSNDLIVANWTIADYAEAHAIIDTIQTYLTDPQWIYGEFNGDGFTDSVRVDIAAVFGSPIDGVFSLLPPYSSQVFTGADSLWWYEWIWNGYEYVIDSFLYDIRSYIEVEITWDADDFEDWEIPDPSISGILPDITTDADFKDLFGLTPAMWEKQTYFRIYLD